MVEFHNTSENEIEKEINFGTKNLLYANVIGVKERHPEARDRYTTIDQTDPENITKHDVIRGWKNRNHEVDIELRHPTGNISTSGEESNATSILEETIRDVPVVNVLNGVTQIPEIGDTVLVGFLTQDDKREPIVLGVMHTDERPAPTARRGTHRIQRGDMKLELYEEKTRTKGKVPQAQFPEYVTIGIEDGASQSAPPTFTNYQVTLTEKGEPEWPSLVPEKYKGTYRFALTGEKGPYIDVDFDKQNEERVVSITGENSMEFVMAFDDKANEKDRVDDIDGGTFRLKDDNGVSFESNTNGGFTLEGAGGAKIQSDGSGNLTLSGDTVTTNEN